jgi:hypothetical protein
MSLFTHFFLFTSPVIFLVFYHHDIYVCIFTCVHVSVDGCVLSLQVPMVGQGVVEALLATLAAVQDGGAKMLDIQEAVCTTLQNLAGVTDNQVRL